MHGGAAAPGKAGRDGGASWVPSAHEVAWLLEQLRHLARLPPSDADGDRVRGLFLASHDVEGLSEWQVRDGALHVMPGDARLHYLDE